jgi:membrane-bound serine protease (ClpP class)
MMAWVPILLFVIGFAALFLELFIPAAGVIGASGIVCMIVATVLGYNTLGKLVGTLFLVGVLIGTPAMIMLGLKAFPKSFVGKRLILAKSFEQKEGYTSADSEKFDVLLDKEGVSTTTLRPSGMVMIDGKKYSVVTSGEMIQKEERIRVIRVDGNRIVVRKVSGPEN